MTSSLLVRFPILVNAYVPLDNLVDIRSAPLLKLTGDVLEVNFQASLLDGTIVDGLKNMEDTGESRIDIA